jgi:hypothetical protein
MNDQTNKSVTLTLPLGAVNMLLGALAKLPYEQVVDLIKVIHDQAAPQVAEPQPTHEISTE